jgi:hypothetical protein
MGALAEWCEGDRDLVAQARTEVLHHRLRVPIAAVETNRHAIQLLDHVHSTP